LQKNKENTMKTITTLMIATCLSIAACAETAPPAASSPKEASQGATKPDAAATKVHLEQHVKYPANRKQILAACADTPEFTTAQKLWFEQNLPEGNYPSAAAVVAALKL
jgi:hypothetical protein